MLSMPTATAANTSTASTMREMGSRTRSGFDEDDDGAGAAVDVARLDERKHLVAAGEDLADALAQHGLASHRPQALAVDDAHAAKPAAARLGQEDGGLGDRLVAGEAVQVEIVLDLSLIHISEPT